MKGFCDVISFDFVHGGKVALRQLQVDDFAACPKYFNLITMPCFVSAPLINWTQMLCLWTKRGKHEKVACLPCVFHSWTADSIRLQNFGSLVPNDQNLLILLYQIISICWRLFIFKNPIELENNFNIHYTFNVFFFPAILGRYAKWFVENPWSWKLPTLRVTLMRHKLSFLCVFLLVYKIDCVSISDFQARVFVSFKTHGTQKRGGGIEWRVVGVGRHCKTAENLDRDYNTAKKIQSILDYQLIAVTTWPIQYHGNCKEEFKFTFACN